MIKPISKNEFDEKLKTDSYYKNRWEYMSVAQSFVMDFNPKTILEVGSRTLPLFIGSDLMDIENYPNVKYVQNATDSWEKVENYDVIIACQVVEHFKNKQQLFWEELIKHTKHAVISIPYMWKNSKIKDHDNLNEFTLSAWFNHTQPIKQRIIESRLIVSYDLTKAMK